MDNYPYIIAGLPDIALDFENRGPDYDETVAAIKEHCSKKDCRHIDWLDAGLDGKNLGPHFYRVLSSRKGPHFLKEYFIFDKAVREAKVAWMDGTPYEGNFDEYESLRSAFATENLIEREMKIDRIMWDKAADLVAFDLFDINVILSFLVRARIVSRWNSLDQKKGTELFRRLVDEVRGTFKGVDFNPNSND